MTSAALGLSGDPVHEPVDDFGDQYSDLIS
jgi:hypothetical protein